MPRITTGTAKNRKIKIPDVPNIRVVQDVYKLALFSILGERVVGAKCLDLYAGSGSFGLEALSRGAKTCDFVDESRKAVNIIKQNLKTCGFEKQAEVHQDNAIKYVANVYEKYDLIFADPFYEDLKHKFLMKNLEEVLENDGIIAFSHSEHLNIKKQIEGIELEIVTERNFGKSFLTLLKKKKN